MGVTSIGLECDDTKEKQQQQKKREKKAQKPELRRENKEI